MHHGRRKCQTSLLRRKIVWESTGQHHRWERMLDVDPPPPWNQATSDPGVVVEGPRGVAVIAVRGSGGGVAIGTTMGATATGSATVAPLSSAPQVS
jgi:hypothetical protein